MAVEAYPRTERSLARAQAASPRFAHRGVVFVANGQGPRGVGAVSKRAIDVAAGATLLVALSPVLLLIAGLVRLDSAGPVVLAQDRVGRGLRSFRIYKFRSMV